MRVSTMAPSHVQRVRWMGTDYAITVTKDDSAGIVGVFEGKVPPRDGPPIHIHHNEDEVVHVIEGDYQFWLDGNISLASSGDSVFLPRGVPHTFRVVGGTPGRNLAILTPGGFETFFIDAAERQLRIPEDMAEVIVLGELYGLEFIGPAQWAD